MPLTPEDIALRFREEFENEVIGVRIRSREQGVYRTVPQSVIWLSISRVVFHRAVSLLKDMGHIHIACPMASKEHDDGIELIYPFTVLTGEGKFMELPVIISVFLPEEDLRIRSVSDILPGILYMERETMEMLGVIIEDIPDSRRLFTPENMQPGVFPMRREPDA